MTADTNFLDSTAAMDVEHKAWQEMLDRLATKLGVERSTFNDSSWNPFIDQLRYWGETLVALREYTEPSDCVRILAEAKALAEEGRP